MNIERLTVIALLLAPLSWGVAIAFYFYRFHGSLSTDAAVWGQFGDFLGGLTNPLISLAGLAAVVATLRANSHALRSAEKQIELMEHERFIQIAFAVNAEIQNYRNERDVRDIRRVITDLYTTQPDSRARLAAITSNSQFDEIARFLAKMNNLCWMANQLPASRGSEKMAILRPISSNLLREWDALLPYIEFRREERRAANVDDGNWYARDLEDVVRYLREMNKAI